MKDSLAKMQSGFKPGFSTETSRLNTTNQWILNIDKKGYNLVLFLNLRKAFNAISYDIPAKKLEHYGISDTELTWFQSYASDRPQYCCIDGYLNQTIS